MKLIKEAKSQAKNEIQITALGLFAVGPIVQFTDLGQNINRYVDIHTNIILAIVMSFAAGVALWGSLWSEVKPGFILELGGWFGLILVFGTYLGIAVWTNDHWYTAVSSLFFLIFTVGAAFRGRKIIAALIRLNKIEHGDLPSE